MTLPAYAELHCLSNFSFLRGASHPRELVARAKALEYSALAITDECSMAGVVRAYEAAKEHALKLIVGTELQLADGMKLVLLAQDREGYGNLCASMTVARGRGKKGNYQFLRGDLAWGMAGCIALWIPPAHAAMDDALWLAARFPQRCWIAYERFLESDDPTRLECLRALSQASGLPLVASGDVHMHVRSRRPLQDTLTALRLKTTIDQAGHALFPNGERYLRPKLRLAELYPPELLEETLRIAALCKFSLNELRYQYPEEIVPLEHTPSSYLRGSVEQGLVRRYPDGIPIPVRKRIEQELDLIGELGYEAYFLTVYDLVKFAREQGILCQGRGSAANSAVCFVLGITEVDPAESETLFERFMSRERKEPPDIDVDFEHQRREEVLQYVYKKYGRARAALTATVISYRSRSALRDTGRALGIALDKIDALTASLGWWDQREQWPERFAAVGLDVASPRVQKWLWLARELVGFPRHLSQHVGGFVISRDRLDRVVPIENAAMPERSVIQWDKDDIDALGLMKVDVLALGMLSAIRRTLEFVSQRRGRKFSMQDIPSADDPAVSPVYDMICRADTIGVFQIESRAQMSMLPRLKPRRFYDLVIEVAIVRPGPIQGDMVHPYLRRRDKIEKVEEMKPEIRAVLGRTLGVPIFQEQAMKLAMVAAGFTADEADQLRRAMAAWRRSGDLKRFEQKLLSGMNANGYSDEFANRVYRQIQGFGEYGFPESHAASFAKLAYVSSWLKHHEPAAFLAGLLNSQPMGFYSPSQLIQDAQRHGVGVRPVDVTASDWESKLEGLGLVAVRLGLDRIRGLRRDAAERIAAVRRDAPFRDVADLARRARLDRSDLDTLAAAGALAMLAGHRHQATWAAAAVPVQLDLLQEAGMPEPAIDLPMPKEGQEILADYRMLHLSLGRHPLALLRGRLKRLRYVNAGRLRELETNQPARCAGIVTGRQRPGTASGVIFVTLEDETGLANVIVHPRLAERQRRELLGARLLGVLGVLQREGEVVHLIARRLVDHSELLGRLPTSSRDFR